MLVQFLLIVSVLLTSVEGTPNNTRHHDSWPKPTIPAGNINHPIYGPCSKTCGFGTREIYLNRDCNQGQNKCVLSTDPCVIRDCNLDSTFFLKYPWDFVLNMTIFAIFIFIMGAFFAVCCINVHSFWKEEKSRRNGEPQCYTDEDSFVDSFYYTPMVKKRDVLENTDISTPDPDYVEFNIEKDKDVAISSDRKHEDKTKIVTDDASHGPMVEKREILESTMIPIPDATDEVINMGPDEDAVTTSDKQEEDKKHIPPPPPVSRITSQVSDIWVELKAHLIKIQQ